MDKRVIGFAVLAVLIGAAVLFAEAMLIGVLAAQAGPITPHDISLGEVEWRGLWHTVVFAWGLPSALGALIIASFKPRRWMLYSLGAIIPQLIGVAFAAVTTEFIGGPLGYQLLSLALHMALLPLFLALYYALIRRHSAA